MNPHKDEAESKRIIKMFIEGNEVYAIMLKEENKIIGSFGIHDRKPDENLENMKQKEFGFVLNPKYWGRGIMPEAVKIALTYCFDELDLDIVWCAYFEGNEKSKRVVEKIGFNYKFTKEEYKELIDKKLNTRYYNISKSEFKSWEKR